MRILNRMEADGGVAALVTVFVTVIMMVSLALVVDIGRQYIIKRQLQTAADAAVLAAGSVLSKTSGACADIAGSADPEFVDARAAAEGVADTQAESNLAGSSSSQTLSFTCPGDGTLVINYGTELSLETAFGGAAGISSLSASREAAAQVFVPIVYTGVRPYAVCGIDFDILKAAEGSPIGIRYDIPLTNGCDASHGDWYHTDCLWDQDDGSHVENTQNGCQNQLNVSASSPLSSACHQTDDETGAFQDCLSAGPGPGAINEDDIDNVWRDHLLGTVQQFPVFMPGTVIDAGGDEAEYPIWRIMSARICGYQWQESSNSEILDPLDSSDTCYGTGAIAATFPNDSSWVTLAYVTSQISGPLTPSTCSIADCNTRAVRLIQ